MVKTQLAEESYKKEAQFNHAFLKLNQKLKQSQVELDPEVKEALDDFKVASMNLKKMLIKAVNSDRNPAAWD